MGEFRSPKWGSLLSNTCTVFLHVYLDPTWGISLREEKNMEYDRFFDRKWNMVEYHRIPARPPQMRNVPN